MKTISASAVISKITTTIDGGYTLTLLLSEDETKIVKELIDWKAKKEVICVAFQEIGA